MQFSAVLLFAGAALATYTKYETVVHTITSCAPEVTNCPAHSTVKHTKTHAVPVAVYTPSGVPNGPYHNGTYGSPSVKPPHPTGGSPAVVTITIDACPATSTPTGPAPVVTLSSYVVPVGSGTGAAPSVTATSVPSVPVSPAPAFTGAASSVSGSIALAGFAGLAALLLA